MGRPKKVEVDKTIAEQDATVLDHEVRLDGVGEAPAVKALLSPEFVKMKDSEALDVVDALREIIRGQKFQSEEITKMRQRFVEFEKDTERWKENQAKFIQDTLDQADRTLKATGGKQEDIRARAAKVYEEEYRKAKATIATDRIAFMQKCHAAPKTTIIGQGKRYLVRKGDTQVWKVEPEVFIMNGVKFVIPANEAVDLPDFVAKEYINRIREKGKLDALEVQLRTDGDFEEAKKIAPEIDPRYDPDSSLVTYGKDTEGLFLAK